MVSYLKNLLIKNSLEHFYERPLVEFFTKCTFYLAIETSILLITQLIYPASKLYYQLYCYICLLHTLIIGYYWHLILPGSHLKFCYHRIYRIILIIIINLGLRNFIYQHYVVDIFYSIIIGKIIIIDIYPNQRKIGDILSLIYSNLTLKIKKHMFFYLLINMINLLIYNWFFVSKN